MVLLLCGEAGFERGSRRADRVELSAHPSAMGRPPSGPTCEWRRWWACQHAHPRSPTNAKAVAVRPEGLDPPRSTRTRSVRRCHSSRSNATLARRNHYQLIPISIETYRDCLYTQTRCCGIRNFLLAFEELSTDGCDRLFQPPRRGQPAPATTFGLEARAPHQRYPVAPEQLTAWQALISTVQARRCWWDTPPKEILSRLRAPGRCRPLRGLRRSANRRGERCPGEGHRHRRMDLEPALPNLARPRRHEEQRR